MPSIIEVADFARNIGCDWLGNISTNPDASCEENICHTNVKNYILGHGGKKILGYYFLESAWGYQAILHSVWQDSDGNLIDITPFADKRNTNVFAKLKNNIQKYTTNNIYSLSLDKYNQEIETMYYIYALIDPRNNMPFYIGKGTGKRAQTHLWDMSRSDNIHKENKIYAIRKIGLEPQIEYLAEDIIDENLAYKMEEDLILRYGRKGYEPYGILTNICLEARPPNHKGRTYQQIYGKEGAKIQRAKRSQLQKERGGYGPKTHSEETRAKFRELNTGSGNPMYGKKQKPESIQKIIENRTLPTGKDHYYSKHWKLTSPIGEVYEQIGNLKGLCKKLNVSFPTIHAAYIYNRVPNRGKTKGWKIEVIEKE
jgi:hypothetical protein